MPNNEIGTRNQPVDPKCQADGCTAQADRHVDAVDMWLCDHCFAIAKLDAPYGTFGEDL